MSAGGAGSAAAGGRRSALTTGCWLLCLSLLLPCGAVTAAGPATPASVAVEFIRQFASGQLTGDSAAGLLGPGTRMERIGDYWSLKSAAGTAEIVLNSARGEPAELRLPLGAGVTLKDLEAIFGPAETVFESKTSSVRFRVIEPAGPPVSAFVRLYTPRPSPDAPVLAILMRRDGADRKQ